MNNLFLICGDDEFLISQEVEKIKSKYDNLEKGINFLMFDKDNMQYLGGELTTYSFFSTSKLIIVKMPKSTRKESEGKEEDDEKEAKATAWFTDELKEQILNKIDDIELVFVENDKPRAAVLKFFTDNGKVISIDKNRLPTVIKSIIEYANSKSLKISRDDASYLAQIVANDVRTAHSTIDILQDYVESDIITRKAIDDISVKTPETIIFNLTDNLGVKKKNEALQNLDDLLGSNEPIQKILITLTRHFRNLLLTKECLDLKCSVEGELAIKSYTAKKYKLKSKNFTKDELVRIFKELYKLDVDSKLQPVDLKIALQRIIMM